MGSEERSTTEVVVPLEEAVELVTEAGGESLKLCFQCGLCTACCPWNVVRSLMVRRLIRQTRFGVVDLESEDWWLCATCGNCVKRCPRGVNIIDIMVALRRIMVEAGAIPASLRIAFASIAGTGNPWGERRERRADWAEGLNIKTFHAGAELLYFPCCTPAYDPRVRPVAQATANILKKVGVDFGILGVDENCCGESVRKAGNESLFQRLARSNIELFTEKNVHKVLVTSPHCYHTFKNEYPEFGGGFEVIHFTQYLAQLLAEGNLTLTKELKMKVTYHDPCYLGRHNDIYDEPRTVLKSIPGVELVEMPDSRENSLCCGGGGGRIWAETKKGERFSDLRIKQAVAVGATVLVTACPYCLLNFEDSLLSLSDSLVVKDISELVAAAI